MKKIVFILVFLSLACGRENPFLPVRYINNPTQPEYFKTFSSYEFSLPANAKIIEDITINYINIDGSVKSLKLDINQTFDWHDSFIISTKKHQSSKKQTQIKPNDIASIAKQDDIALDIKEKKDEKKIFQDLEQKEQSMDTSLVQTASKNQDDILKEIDVFGLATIEYNLKSAFIKSDYELLRYFTLPNPERIVLDFKKTIDYKPKTFNFENSYFTKLTLGSHNGFFRLVFFPDAKYLIEINPKKDHIEVLMK